MLVDADPNHSALNWAERGGLPFEVVSEQAAGEYAPDYEHIVIDTQGRPDQEDLEALADGCDLLVIPSTPDGLALDAVMLTVNEMEELGREEGYRVLLTSVPPWPVRSGAKARTALDSREVPMFEGHIRRREAFQKAGTMGVLVHEIKDRRAVQGWDDYKQIGEEILRLT